MSFPVQRPRSGLDHNDLASGVGTDMDIAGIAGASVVTFLLLACCVIGVAVGKCIKFGMGESND